MKPFRNGSVLKRCLTNGMWADDVHWLPGVLAGKKFLAWFDFDGDRMLSRRVEWIGQ